MKLKMTFVRKVIVGVKNLELKAEFLILNL
jgi:hypothetical protein